MIEDTLVKKTYFWDKKSSITLAVKSNKIYVLNYNPTDQKATILTIPDETYLTLPKGFGSWPLGSVYQLGQEESPPIGSELLKQSLAKLLGLPIDGFITFKSSLSSRPLDLLINDWKANPITAFMMIKDIETDLTPLEVHNLVFELRGVRADKIINLDLLHSEITQSKLLPDSTRVLGVNNVSLDLFIRKNLADPTIQLEDLPIAIYNSTTHPGLALELSRIIVNMGGRVIFTGNTENFQENTTIISQAKDSWTSKKLMQLFAPLCLQAECSSDDPRIQNSRATINIILGENFYNDLYTR